jgi:hypothetical protein
MSSLAEAFLEEAFSFDEAFKLPPLLQILKIEKDNLGLIQYALQYLWFEIFVIFRDIPQYEFLVSI